MKKAIISTALLALSAQTLAQQANAFPEYYKDIEPIVVKDTMLQYFGTTPNGVISYGLEDAAKASGHVCPAVTGAFLMTRAGIQALAQHYRDHPNSDNVTSYDKQNDVIYRGGVKITMGGKENSGSGANAMGDVMSYITGARGADGFKNGPGFPFANRRHLFRYDNTMPSNPKTGIEAIFTSMIAHYEKKDADGKWQAASFTDCEGTRGECREITQCDHSVKVSYHFKSPEIIGSDPKAAWVDKIKHILDNADKALTVEAVSNPTAICAQ